MDTQDWIVPSVSLLYTCVTLRADGQQTDGGQGLEWQQREPSQTTGIPLAAVYPLWILKTHWRSGDAPSPLARPTTLFTLFFSYWISKFNIWTLFRQNVSTVQEYTSTKYTQSRPTSLPFTKTLQFPLTPYRGFAMDPTGSLPSPRPLTLWSPCINPKYATIQT